MTEISQCAPQTHSHDMHICASRPLSVVMGDPIASLRARARERTLMA